MRFSFRFSQCLVLAAVTLSTVLAGTTIAQDAASLEAAVVDFYDKLNAEDATYSSYFLPDGYQFPRDGTLLQPNADLATARANFETGLDFEVALHHLDTQVFGDTGVATYYTTGATTYPDGTILTGTFRASITATRQGNQWRWAHLHISELETGPELPQRAANHCSEHCGVL